MLRLLIEPKSLVTGNSILNSVVIEYVSKLDLVSIVMPREKAVSDSFFPVDAKLLIKNVELCHHL